ncbi:MAG: rRNA biogenesis protein rrp5 [Eubacteriaceae bacterium]|nr:rRNA biogenesis protein rrp5 [Eubacteriaceae bacterium]
MSKIKLALDVVNDLKALAESIEILVQAMESENEITIEGSEEKEVKDRLVETADIQPEEKQPTLEELRAVLADKNREGHREAVKDIILKYGANKLTTLDPVHFAQVLKEVGELK